MFELRVHVFEYVSLPRVFNVYIHKYVYTSVRIRVYMRDYQKK